MKWPVSLDPFVDEQFYSIFQESPFVLYDVGARGGVYPLFKNINEAKMLKIYGFEPNEQAYAELQKKYRNNKNIHLIDKAASDHAGSATFHLMGGSSSLLNYESESPEITTVECVRLDDLVEHKETPPPSFLKIDVEGAELKVLKGANNLLQKDVMGITCEISFWKGHEGRCFFSEIDSHLTDLGFILFDVTINRSQYSGIGGKKSKVRTGDALYLRNFDYYYKQHKADGMDSTQLKTQLLKLIAICYRFYYFDYVYELAHFGEQNNILNESERNTIVNSIREISDVSFAIPEFPGKRHLAFVIDFLSYILHKHAKKGTPDLFNGLGNRRMCLIKTRKKIPQISNPVFPPTAD
jgi:FkbM family methyltransferase